MEVIDLCDSSDDERPTAPSRASAGAAQGPKAAAADDEIMVIEPEPAKAGAEIELDENEDFAIVAETGKASIFHPYVLCVSGSLPTRSQGRATRFGSGSGDPTCIDPTTLVPRLI